MTFRIIAGDCVEAMQAMDENTVDAIVTDPPYGLEFMGKEWDALSAKGRGAKVRERRAAEVTPNGQGHTGSKGPYLAAGIDWQGVNQSEMQAWHHAWATEALRILKPGGYLLAFGGTRTYHRLACAIEDAGFEIRDTLAWLYGSGFPKSLDVSKAIDKARDDSAEGAAVGAWLKAQREAAGFKQKQVAALWPSVTGGLTGCVANWETLGKVPTWDQWLMLKKFIGFGDEMDAEVWRLNGRKGTPGDAWDQREVLGVAKGAGTRGNTFPLAPDYDATAPATPEAQRWQGWGTALKPAHEPIVMARKPLSERNVAANVQRWGTGALNIDGCRIESEGHLQWSRPRDMGYHGGTDEGGTAETNPSGRWPPNVALGHHPECEPTGQTRKVRSQNPKYRSPDKGATGMWGVEGQGGKGPRPANVGIGHADEDGTETVQVWECHLECAVEMLDAQSGDGRARGNVSPTTRNGESWFGAHGAPGGIDPGDTGGASRFMYVPKADREERNRGLEHMERKTRPVQIQQSEGREMAGRAEAMASANSHPTVKPVELMRWLCRMITPPKGTILDPFTGSGTTGVAALREGFKFVGIERESEYVEIARARIVGDAPLFNVEVPA